MRTSLLGMSDSYRFGRDLGRVRMLEPPGLVDLLEFGRVTRVT